MGEVLLFSLTAMANPTLVAVTTVMLLLPSPRQLMLYYLLGALFTSITLGLVIVFAAKRSGVVSSGKTTINPAIDFAFGGLLILVAIVLRTGRDKPYRDRRAERKREKPHKTPRWQKALTEGNPKFAIIVGALLTLPGASYLAALTSIAKLNYSRTVTVLVVLLVNVIMLALLEVPLICFTVAPDWTPQAIERVKAAFSRNGRRLGIYLSGAIGSLLILRAVITLIAS
jgi:Sap, sulfolipid-1-addressing protein